ncbi:DUF4352 domain-containing protein [Streptomyces sp. ASQP_92]|uniref:DUF4190 domain-containing protein n=1 Tax=Streptomyces sp. ASQP_92 TaxID=2979116 RepID=UPI0021BF2126|nr:DUF4190 domain-containing protein [Streptomyces sp. ASQP_92]MCT9093847.1 DUF4352 domain-containing protein [Streptomyces sp. ASQP_92]
MADLNEPERPPDQDKGAPPPPPPPGASGGSAPNPSGPWRPVSTAPRNGLGIAALILGIIGLISGITPILFWMAGILGIVALVLGIIGARRAKQGYATNRRMSIAGATLGGLAIVMSIIGIVIVADVFNDVSKEIGPTKTAAPATPAPSTTTSPGTTTPSSGTLPFSATQRYKDGLQVQVSPPRPFTPSDSAAGYTPGDKAVAVDVTVTNGSDNRASLDLVSVQAKDADGRSAETIFDSAQGINGLTGTVLPGKKSVATFVFDLPKSASSSLDVEVRPGFDYESAVWSGSSS